MTDNATHGLPDGMAWEAANNCLHARGSATDVALPPGWCGGHSKSVAARAYRSSRRWTASCPSGNPTGRQALAASPPIPR